MFKGNPTWISWSRKLYYIMKILWSECISRQENTFVSIYAKNFQATTFEALIAVKMRHCQVITQKSDWILAYAYLLAWHSEFVAAWRGRSGSAASSLKGRAGGGRAQRMVPPVAAPHCGICSRPFRLLTWRHKPVPGAASLCSTRRFRGAKRPSSEFRVAGGCESDPARDSGHLFVGHNLRAKSLLSTVVRFFRGKCGPGSSRCVFRWICARRRNESSGEDPAALPAALLLWSRAARCHVDRSDPPGTRWDTYLQTLIWFSNYSVLLACMQL